MQKKYSTIKIWGRRQGFALAFTVLISTIVLTIALSMYLIFYKELVLSGVGKESQIAFYAADLGIECVLKNDLKGGVNNPPNSPFPDQTNFLTWGGDYVSCLGGQTFGVGTADGVALVEDVNSDQTWIRTSFEIPITIPGTTNQICAVAYISKTVPPVTQSTQTTIVVNGHNTPCGSVDSRQVERTIRVTY